MGTFLLVDGAIFRLCYIYMRVFGARKAAKFRCVYARFAQAAFNRFLEAKSLEYFGMR